MSVIEYNDWLQMGPDGPETWPDGLLGDDAFGRHDNRAHPPMQDERTEPMPLTIGDRVKQLRKDHGLTQEDLAAKSGLGVATIQRVERGEHPAAATIASIASAFDLSPTTLTSLSMAAAANPAFGSYLPLSEITSGKALIDLVASASAIDFDYMEIGDETAADLMEKLYRLCQDREVPSNPANRIRLDIQATKLLGNLKAINLTVAGATYERTCHDVDESDGPGLSMLLATWEETCLVIRVGTRGEIVDRADVEERMWKWTSMNDPKIVRHNPPQSEEMSS
jgi:transcriptional regulator with XRE-family HTH domain